MNTKLPLGVLAIILLSTFASPVLAQSIPGNGPIWGTYGIAVPATVGSYKVFGPDGVLLYDEAVDGPNSPYARGSGVGVVAGATVVTTDPNSTVMVGQSDACVVFTDFVFAGHANQSANTIIEIQNFLNAYQNAGLSLTGVYDSATIGAVKTFQLTHASEVLAPWGLTTPTGNVYLTTVRAMNIENCLMQGKSLTLALPIIPTPITQVASTVEPSQNNISSIVNAGLSTEVAPEAPTIDNEAIAINSNLSSSSASIDMLALTEESNPVLWLIVLAVIILAVIIYRSRSKADTGISTKYVPPGTK